MFVRGGGGGGGSFVYKLQGVVVKQDVAHIGTEESLGMEAQQIMCL